MANSFKLFSFNSEGYPKFDKYYNRSVLAAYLFGVGSYGLCMSAAFAAYFYTSLAGAILIIAPPLLSLIAAVIISITNAKARMKQVEK